MLSTLDSLPLSSLRQSQYSVISKYASLVDAYQRFRIHSDKFIQQARSASPHIKDHEEGSLPDEIDPSKPYSIPRIFMDVLGAIFKLKGGHLHLYKKF